MTHLDKLLQTVGSALADRLPFRRSVQISWNIDDHTRPFPGLRRNCDCSANEANPALDLRQAAYRMHTLYVEATASIRNDNVKSAVRRGELQRSPLDTRVSNHIVKGPLDNPICDEFYIPVESNIVTKHRLDLDFDSRRPDIAHIGTDGGE
jgi:hypothetical protein